MTSVSFLQAYEIILRHAATTQSTTEQQSSAAASPAGSSGASAAPPRLSPAAAPSAELLPEMDVFNLSSVSISKLKTLCVGWIQGPGCHREREQDQAVPFPVT